MPAAQAEQFSRMHGLFLSEIDPPAIGHNFCTAFKNQRLTSSGVSLFGIVQVLYYTCTEHPSRVLFWPMWRCALYTRPERSFPIALSDTLWFLFGLGAALSFREPVDPRGPSGGFKGFLGDLAATLCVAWCRFMIQGTAVANIADRLVRYASEQRLDGVTLSGGEPMQQAHELAALLREVWTAAPEISLGMFTGYSLGELDSGRFWTRGGGDRDERIGLWRSIRSRLDFAVMGRYNRRQPSTDPLRTSENQELHIFSSRHSEADFEEQAVEITMQRTA
jgi:hypothetical protein